jgi:hypothetical protein
MKPLAGIFARLRQFALIIALVFLGVLLDPERWIGGVVWTLGTAYLVYRYGFFLVAPHLLPIAPDRESRGHARELLWRFARGAELGLAVVRDGKVLADSNGAPRNRAAGPGAILVDGTSVAVLNTNLGLSRIKGRGVHFLRDDEHIGGVIDLRPQSRAREIESQTRDGIWVKFTVGTRFQIDGTSAVRVQDVDQLAAPWPDPFTWSPRQVQRAVSLERVTPESSVDWDDLALHQATTGVHNLIAEYTYDQLTRPQDAQSNAVSDLQRRLETEVKNSMAGSGIKVLGVSIGPIAPRDRRIDDQRIERWSADSMRRIRKLEGESNAETNRLMDMARIRGQREWIMRIAHALRDSLEQGDPGDVNEIVRHLLNTADQFAGEPEVGSQEDTRRMQQSLIAKEFFERLGPEFFDDPDFDPRMLGEEGLIT